MEENNVRRDRFRSICKKALSVDKYVSFAAILDSCGKIIAGHSKKGRHNNEKKYQLSYQL